MGHRRERCPLGCMEAIQIDPVLRFFGSERCETMRSIGGGESPKPRNKKEQEEKEKRDHYFQKEDKMQTRDQRAI